MKKIYCFAAVSIFFWSTIATISKLLLTSLSSYLVLSVSTLFGALSLLIVNIVTGNIKNLKTYRAKDFLIIALIGLPGTFFYYVFYYAGTARMPASQAFIVNYLWPIMSVIFACILLKEKMTTRKLLAIAMSFLGVFTVAGNDLIHFNADTLIGAFFCILGAVCYGSFTALNQRWSYDKRLATMIFFFISFILSSIISLCSGVEWHITVPQLLGMACNGIFTMAIASTTWAIALEAGKTAKISNLAYITPFLSLVWTRLFLKETITPWAILGLCIIIFGILIQLRDKPTHD